MKMRKWFLYALVLLGFLAALSRLETGRSDQGRQQLEKALRHTAVSCFASEGVYPPSVKYMEERYGLQYDKKKYTVHYEVFASKLMPDITVLEVSP